MQSLFISDIRELLDRGISLRSRDKEISTARLYMYIPMLLIFTPGALAVGLYRLSSAILRLPLPTRFVVLAVDRLNTLLTGIQLPAWAEIGPGLRISHPQSVIVVPNLRAGRGLHIVGAAVTIGWVDLERDPVEQAVEIGDNVTISAGAKVLGPITLGSDVQIGPNVVVMQDVPDGASVISSARAKVMNLKADQGATPEAEQTT